MGASHSAEYRQNFDAARRAYDSADGAVLEMVDRYIGNDAARLAEVMQWAAKLGRR